MLELIINKLYWIAVIWFDRVIHKLRVCQVSYPFIPGLSKCSISADLWSLVAQVLNRIKILFQQ